MSAASGSCSRSEPFLRARSSFPKHSYCVAILHQRPIAHSLAIVPPGAHTQCVLIYGSSVTISLKPEMCPAPFTMSLSFLSCRLPTATDSSYSSESFSRGCHIFPKNIDYHALCRRCPIVRSLTIVLRARAHTMCLYDSSLAHQSGRQPTA
jgi:hypothetical protein